jgi:hypothetical protein
VKREIEVKVIPNIENRISEMKARIRKMEQDAGWYGGISGTEFYNRDWKKNVSAAKKELRALEAQAKRK